MSEQKELHEEPKCQQQQQIGSVQIVACQVDKLVDIETANANDNNNNKMHHRHQHQNYYFLSHRTKSYLTVVGASLIYFAMGLYFAAGSTGVYLSSYLIYRSQSSMQLNDAIWFLSAAGFSALLLPLGGWLEGKVGVRAVCLLGGTLQSAGIFATYWALDTTFLIVVIVYGGSFLVSLAACYTSPLVNVCKWHPNRQGLVSGIGAASMAVAPSVFTPLITALVNPHNVAPNSDGLFDDPLVLDRTKSSTLIQGAITLTLFLVGSALTFQAPSDCDLKEEDIEKCNTTNKLYQQESIDNPNADHQHYKPNASNPNAITANKQQKPSLEPRFAFKTTEFWLLSFKVLISELIFIYLLFIYKPYGQTFISDDYFLSSVGAACAISNTLGRLSMGHFKDKLGYRAVSIPLSFATTFFVASLPLAKALDSKFMYGVWVVLAVGAVGSQYALMPSATQDSFGPKFASINIGFVYMSTVVATVSSALLSQYLTKQIGWQGMIYLIAACASLDFFATLFMPSNPANRLSKRYKQFYINQNYANKQQKPTTKRQETKSTLGKLLCPNCNCHVYVNNAFEDDLEKELSDNNVVVVVKVDDVDQLKQRQAGG